MLDKDKVENLEKAAFYSPDQLDLTNKSYFFYDAVLLTGNTNDVDYKMKYYKHLVENDLVDKALGVISAIAFEKPLDENINQLKSCYSKLQSNQPFGQYWLNYINSNCKQVPQLSSEFSDIKLQEKSGQWKFIDIWGTWCKPCVGGLPAIQEFYDKSKKTNSSKIQVLTFSYDSQRLNEFMQENEYTFPVFEVNNEVIKAFNITHYPTKLLITPQGKYLEIPSKVDWENYIKNYSLQ
ncbi:TlpA family protein disulfide reductase [Carboxylicivirga caseinilyticus]|uniref:TlpA family protein disulfide reductase n=1 Tax=Carboxylicivirga caseinilyticus TaxID=3417572 RepID=UPI003D35385F|nr:TlpA family protein disulfide reductase [Marinilabiliaceae bacterium A049]